MRILAKIQFIVILIGLVFNLGLWAGDLMAWIQGGEEVLNPFISLEFITLLLFLVAFVISVFMLVGGAFGKAKDEETEGGGEEDGDLMEEIEEE